MATQSSLAVADVFRTHFGFVWRTCRRLGVPAHLLDDAVQDVFLVVHRRFERLGPGAEVRAWLFQIARRVSRDHRRSEQRRASRSTRSPSVDEETLASPEPGPDETLARIEAAAFLHRFLERLDDDRRALFTQVELEQMSVTEVAEAMRMNLNTAFSRLRAARKEFDTLAERHRRRHGWKALFASLGESTGSVLEAARDADSPNVADAARVLERLRQSVEAERAIEVGATSRSVGTRSVPKVALTLTLVGLAASVALVRGLFHETSLAQSPAPGSPPRTAREGPPAPAWSGISPGALVGGEGCEVPGVDPFQFAALGIDGRSHWLQPWRSFADTWPAARMRQAVGLSIGGAPHGPEELDLAAIARAGVARFRLFVPWRSARFEEPGRLKPLRQRELHERLLSLRAAGIRPTLVLWGHSIQPVPQKAIELRLIAPATKGSKIVRVHPADLSKIVPGRTGLSRVSTAMSAEILITSTSPRGEAALARPLPSDLPAGRHPAATLRFAPFAPPRLPDGTPNPVFEETLSGWLAFVRGVVETARGSLGDDEFDLEIWNELRLASEFLDEAYYHGDPAEVGKSGPREAIYLTILERTVRLLRDPSLALHRLGIGNGFSKSAWWESSSTIASGVTALCRNLRIPRLAFPEDRLVAEARPLDAAGDLDGDPAMGNRWKEAFTPRYEAHFPEIFLTALLPHEFTHPGQVIRDLAPIATENSRGALHGREVGPGGDPQAELWISSFAFPVPASRNEAGAPSASSLKATAWLRALSAYVGKGARVLMWHAPQNHIELSITDSGDPGGGAVLGALGRFMGAFAGPSTVAPARALRLAGIRSCSTSLQFEGDGTARRPPLFNRQLVAFFPFQVTARRFVVPVYVMTRTLAPLPPEPFDLVIEGVDGQRVLASLSDPITQEELTPSVLERSAGRVTLRVPLTESPRLLSLEEP
jgi:RNA polymerase sigma factor (sigma-70 family)